MSVILIVDDALVDLTRTRMLVEKHIPNAEVLTASNGAEAWEIIEKSVPNLVITDLQMMPVNGLELVVKIREKHAQLPVILMTAAGSEQIATEALKRGASSYVPKRRLQTDLAELVNRLLGADREKRNRLNLLRYLHEVTFTFDNDRDLLVDFVHEFREFLLSQRLLEQNDCFRIATALDEALSNAYYHGNLEVSSKLREQDTFSFENLANERLTQAPYAGRKIELNITFDDHLQLSIRDEGPGFDQKKLPDPDDASFVERPCGRGVVLMRAFMDSVEFNETGNQVKMTKKMLHPAERKQPL